MSENKRAILSLTETDVMELRNLVLAAASTPKPDENINYLHDKWSLRLESMSNIMSSTVPIHFTDLGTEP